MRRFRLFLREILGVLRQLDPLALAPFKFVQSDLFECEVHLEEICDIMCIAVAGIIDIYNVHTFIVMYMYEYCLLIRGIQDCSVYEPSMAYMNIYMYMLVHMYT